MTDRCGTCGQEWPCDTAEPQAAHTEAHYDWCNGGCGGSCQRSFDNLARHAHTEAGEGLTEAQVAALQRHADLVIESKYPFAMNSEVAGWLLALIRERAAVEQIVRDRQAPVEALADEWDGTVFELPPGYPMTVNEFCRLWFKAPLRAALRGER